MNLKKTFETDYGKVIKIEEGQDRKFLMKCVEIDCHLNFHYSQIQKLDEDIDQLLVWLKDFRKKISDCDFINALNKLCDNCYYSKLYPDYIEI